MINTLTAFLKDDEIFFNLWIALFVVGFIYLVFKNYVEFSGSKTKSHTRLFHFFIAIIYILFISHILLTKKHNELWRMLILTLILYINPMKWYDKIVDKLSDKWSDRL